MLRNFSGIFFAKAMKETIEKNPYFFNKFKKNETKLNGFQKRLGDEEKKLITWTSESNENRLGIFGQHLQEQSKPTTAKVDSKFEQITTEEVGNTKRF